MSDDAKLFRLILVSQDGVQVISGTYDLSEIPSGFVLGDGLTPLTTMREVEEAGSFAYTLDFLNYDKGYGVYYRRS